MNQANDGDPWEEAPGTLRKTQQSVEYSCASAAEIALHLDFDEMDNLALSVGSTTAVEIEDDASSKIKGATGLDVDKDEGDGYKTPDGEAGLDEEEGGGYKAPERECKLPYCGAIYEPECDDASLEPALGMVFDSWEKGKAFYKTYAHHVGFSVHTWTQHKDRGGIQKWKRFVCSCQGWRKEEEKVDENGEKQKAKRRFKMVRCGCEAMIGFKRTLDGKYEVAQFVRSHTHNF